MASALRSAGPRRGIGLGLVLLLFVVCAGELAAQEPVPPDTVPAPQDTIMAPQDTAVVRIPPEQVAQDTLPRAEEPAEPDSLRPAPNLPRFPRMPVTGFGEARWEWSAEDLGRWHGLSLVELLEQVPGLQFTRAGAFGQPAGLAAFGLGGGRVRVFLDGFELDPLASATFDVQQIPVVDLESVRVERLLHETRIELTTFRLPDRRSYSQIEAGTATFNTRILRGLFSTTTGARGVFSLGIDITDTDGWLRQQPFAANTLFGRWAFDLGRQTGVQVEYRQTNVERAGELVALTGDRSDLVIRARSLPAPGLALDAMFGRSVRNAGEGDSIGIDLSSVQSAIRARYDAGPAWIGLGARMRNDGRIGFAAPTLDLSVEAGLRPTPWLSATGEVRRTSYGGIDGTELDGGVRLGPFAGLSVFASAASGSRALGIARDTLITLSPEEPGTGEPDEPGELIVMRSVNFPAVSSRISAFRAGAEWSGWGIRLGAAYLSHDVDSIAPFGLAFDRNAEPIVAQPATGFEAYGSIPLFYPPLRLEGSYVRWTDTGARPYLPEDFARYGLSFSEQFYGGNLEPTLRVEATRRGAALVPGADGALLGALSTPYTMYNLFLQIRVLDVRAFLIWENLTNNQLAADLPGRGFGGQRAIYGVRWHFFD